MKTNLFFLILVTSLFGCNKNHYPQNYSAKRVDIDQSIQPSKRIEYLISPYKDSLDLQMNQEIGVFAHDMTKKKPESELGNFMCDATQEYINGLSGGVEAVDLTIMNYGGIRVQFIPKGQITVETLFELMPFENTIVELEVSGAILISMFEKIAANGGWPVSKDVYLSIENQKINELLIHGKPIVKEKTYTLLTTDYVANGGNGMDMLSSITQKRGNIKLRDILISYCEWKTDIGEEIKANITGRVVNNH